MSTDHIATGRQSASRAVVPTIRKGLRHTLSAHARLAGAARVNLLQHSPGAFCLLREHLDKGPPSGVVNGLRQHSAASSLHVQIFDGNQSVPVDQLARQLVLEVAPLVDHVSVGALQQHHGLTATVAPLVLSPRHLPLSAAKPRLRRPVVPGVGDLRPIGQRGETVQANIDSGSAVTDRERSASCSTLKITNQRPASRLTVTVFTSPSTGPVKFDLDVSRALDAQFAVGRATGIRRRRTGR